MNVQAFRQRLSTPNLKSGVAKVNLYQIFFQLGKHPQNVNGLPGGKTKQQWRMRGTRGKNIWSALMLA